MKIVDLRATPVTVPAEAPWRWSMGIETGTTRTIIELITDEGIVGIGETYGGVRTVEALEIAKPFIVGLDPLETGLLQHRLGVFCIGYEMSVPPLVRAGIEMACLDAAGKALGRTVASLLGGAVRDGVDVAQLPLLPLRVGGRPAAGRRHAPRRSSTGPNELVERNGHKVHKLKGGVLPPARGVPRAQACCATASRTTRSSGTRTRPGRSRRRSASAAG